MSLLVSRDRETARTLFGPAAAAEEVVARQLREGMAPVVERWDRSPDLLVTWAFAPNRPSYGLGFAMRDQARVTIEGVTR